MEVPPATGGRPPTRCGGHPLLAAGPAPSAPSPSLRRLPFGGGHLPAAPPTAATPLSAETTTIGGRSFSGRPLALSAASSPMREPPSSVSTANPAVQWMHSPDRGHPHYRSHTARAATLLTLAPLSPRRPPSAGGHLPSGGQPSPAAASPPPGGHPPPARATILWRRPSSPGGDHLPCDSGHLPGDYHRAPRAAANPPPSAATPPLRRPPTADGQPQAGVGLVDASAGARLGGGRSGDGVVSGGEWLCLMF